MQKLEDDRLKNKNFIDAWKKAFNGIWYAIKTQRNVKIQISIAVVIIAICIIAKPSKVECIFLTFATMLVIIAEVMNTAIEATVDLVTKEYHPMAKIAKDVAAGAVVLAAINAVIVAILIIFM